MKRSYFTLAVLALLAMALAPISALAAQEAEPVQVAALAHEDLGLYFDEAELTMVESTSHAPKPITQVAENVTVITALDIERWNAHSLDEVLMRVPGVFVGSYGHEVKNGGTIHIQGSDYEHVQVFLDGMRWNDLSSDYNQTNQIPVEIIERVEVIKGPASSTWGSSLGGAINIITKSAGVSPRPSGIVTASYGEGRTRGTSAQVAGLAGPVGYFLHGGLLDSDGLKDDRWLDDENLFAKLSAPLPAKTTLTLTMGHTNPASRYIASKGMDLDAQWDEAIRFATATLTRPLGQSLHLSLYGSLLDKRYDDYRQSLSTQTPGWDYSAHQWGHSGAIRLYGDLANHSLSVGAETYRNAYDEYEALWVQHRGYTIPEETWAIYANDTIRWGRAAITPGLRYDAISIADSQLSPSLGLTFRLNQANLLRASVARGFRRPVPMLKNPNPDFFSVGNPALESETVLSYQMGIESVAIPALLVKATLFRHDAEHTWVTDPASGAWVNGDAVTREGVELELETERWQGVALMANHTYVHFRAEDGSDPGNTSTSNLILDYQGPWGLGGRLAGNYVWLNSLLMSPGGHDGTMLWDLTASKQLQASDLYRLDLFASVRNLFNGSQYAAEALVNADRWLEAGLRLHF